MAQAANKLYGRAEIRNELIELRNDCARLLVTHRDAFRNDPAHVEATCKTCIDWNGRIAGFDRAIRHFGGRL